MPKVAPAAGAWAGPAWVVGLVLNGNWLQMGSGCVAIESESDVFSHFVFNEVLPDDDLLYYNEHSALVDGPHGSLHSFVNSSAPSGHPG